MPSTIKRSAKGARETWAKAHDSAVETYGEGESAHRGAYAALQQSYRKEGDHWAKTALPGPFGAQAARGPSRARKMTGPAAAPAHGSHVAGEERTRKERYARATHFDVAARSNRDNETFAEAVPAAKAR